MKNSWDGRVDKRVGTSSCSSLSEEWILFPTTTTKSKSHYKTWCKQEVKFDLTFPMTALVSELNRLERGKNRIPGGHNYFIKRHSDLGLNTGDGEGPDLVWILRTGPCGACSDVGWEWKSDDVTRNLSLIVWDGGTTSHGLLHDCPSCPMCLNVLALVGTLAYLTGCKLQGEGRRSPTLLWPEVSFIGVQDTTFI